ncbi:MAG TPA: hypothetical protein VFY79_06745 [Dehalococcoidia bacterium]|nr:hypothetical protein [Dehalococcoidia bacterium]
MRRAGRDVDIYFDDVFPYAILFEEFVDQQELYIHVVLPMLARRDRGR